MLLRVLLNAGGRRATGDEKERVNAFDVDEKAWAPWRQKQTSINTAKGLMVSLMVMILRAILPNQEAMRSEYGTVTE